MCGTLWRMTEGQRNDTGEAQASPAPLAHPRRAGPVLRLGRRIGTAVVYVVAALLSLLPGVDWLLDAQRFREEGQPWGSSWDGCFLVLGFFVSVVPLVVFAVWAITRSN